MGTWKLGDSPYELIHNWIGLGNCGGKIQVLRYADDKYNLLTFNVAPGDLKAEYHFHPVNNQEYKLIKEHSK